MPNLEDEEAEAYLKPRYRFLWVLVLGVMILVGVIVVFNPMSGTEDFDTSETGVDVEMRSATDARQSPSPAEEAEPAVEESAVSEAE